ncbi:MAG: teichuronic acid biosynthesis glycosyltransferase TuaH, partial [Acidimicrobiaceae bacterium]
ACDERRRIVFATDDFVAGAELMGVRRSVLQAQQQRQARSADLVVCVTPEIAETWTGLGVETAVLANGCDPELFADVDDTPYASDVTLPSPIVGCVGHLSDRIDVALLDAVADTGVSLLLVGPRQPVDGLDRLLARANVQWIDQRPLTTMPGYLRWIDVGLTPYADTAFNRGSFPLKTLDYLAAGRRVVATGLPATRRLDTDLVTIADTPADFAAAVTSELARPVTNDDVQRRQAFAAANSWEARAAELRKLVAT